MLRKGVTDSFGSAIHSLKAAHLTDTVIQRSKRMILDTLGVGLLGSTTAVFNKVLQYSKMYRATKTSTVWGRSDLTLPPPYAAFVNGVAVHSMDFDDTWHPATHPSGAVLPALLALAETLNTRTSGLELLLAFNVGVEVQGRLMRFSKEAHNIPKRFHPPAVVGIMGSAAASAKLLGLEVPQCREALAIAASYAGAPMANAATQTKPLHIGNATRRGLEAAYLSLLGLEGNRQILDMDSGFGAFYTDYTPDRLPNVSSYRWILEDQDVAFKRFPAHLGMHWVADAAAALRARLLATNPNMDFKQIKHIVLRVPNSRYINCPFPASEHEARHSFQFNACTAMLDGKVSVESFSSCEMDRMELKELLAKAKVENPQDNLSNFDTMYCEVQVELNNGEAFTERCNTFYGHWRKPLSQADLCQKFRDNASLVLPLDAVEGVINLVDNLEQLTDVSVLSSCLQMNMQTQLCQKMPH